MSTDADKTPLQAVVSVVCDALCALPVADQARAIEAVCVTLGIPRTLSPPSSPPPSVAAMTGASPIPAARAYGLYGARPTPMPRGGGTDTPNGNSVWIRPLPAAAQPVAPPDRPFVLRLR